MCRLLKEDKSMELIAVNPLLRCHRGMAALQSVDVAVDSRSHCSMLKKVTSMTFVKFDVQLVCISTH